MEIHHHACGFFATVQDAHATRAALIERGIPRDQLHIYQPDTPATGEAPAGGGSAVLKDALFQGAIGTAVGTGIGALAQVGLVATGVSLFIASPLLAPLVMMGWGASIGALVGTAMGATSRGGASAQRQVGWLSDLVTDAVDNGQFVLVADTRTQQQIDAAQAVMKASVGDFQNVASA